MGQLFIKSIILAMVTIGSVKAQNQISDFSEVKVYEQQLDDVMEIIDTAELKLKLLKVEQTYKKHPNDLNKVRLGIIYHETALNLSFFSKTEYKGYAQKSYDLLTALSKSPNTKQELMPFVASYRASALALVGAETKKLKFLGEAFSLFDEAVTNYSNISYLPEFLRGSVAENLPWF